MTCAGCGVTIARRSKFGVPPKWCSDKCRKRTLYSGVCVDCGGRTDGIASGRTPVIRCSPCTHSKQHRAAVTRILAAMWQWADENGGVPPKAEDWNPAMARSLGHFDVAARYERGAWPAAASVQRVFGSWNAGLLAAGFEPFATGTYGRVGEDMDHCREVRARYEAGESLGVLAADYCCSRTAISYRLRKAGGIARSPSEAQTNRRAA